MGAKQRMQRPRRDEEIEELKELSDPKEIAQAIFDLLGETKTYVESQPTSPLGKKLITKIDFALENWFSDDEEEEEEDSDDEDEDEDEDAQDDD